jgi:hypothetical protein
MLKNIRLHIEKDEEKQLQLEKKLAGHILKYQRENLNSFERNIPSVVPLIRSARLQNQSLFCNKYGEINVVDYGIGRTLYGFHPEAEVHRQIDEFNRHAPLISLSGGNKSIASKEQASSLLTNDFKQTARYQSYLSAAPCPSTIDCLVVLGCGLGLHLLTLMQTKKITCLLIYEPEIQYFQCSALVTPWKEIFDIAKQNGTKIFLQLEKDGRNLVADINELVEHELISSFYLYKHYNHPVFNRLFLDLTTKSWRTLQEQGVSFSFDENYNHYLPTWTPAVNISQYTSCDVESPIFKNNLRALEQYFPNIYHEFKHYQPTIWLPVVNANEQINIVKIDCLAPWYGDDPKQDCLLNYENFNEQPHKDGLVLGYTGTKLVHYVHYQFVKQTEHLLTEAEDKLGTLPKDIASIIMFGLGVGYQLETLLENHQVEKLFLCEPNRDFFYASLFSIDWQAIFAKIEQSEARIYLNIGDDGTHLFRDLLNQFHSIGPYILNNTYFYQSYFNASLNSAIAQLREQLQVVISMGEYFDHAFYGIEHTKEGFRRQFPLLTKTPSSQLSYADKEVPVFIVGNGPSLDMSIEAIRESAHQAIVVSCGTALQALHRQGIVPDFHAEIEQNRSTYDWAMMVGDRDYLKKITLISCNGVHPDTCDLYKNVLIALKEGESSTVSAQSILGQQQFEVLQHAFPTVSNLVTNIFSVMGFHSIYLMGVDLGFIDLKYHHSKASGYYKEDGSETYDYSKGNNTSLVVPGNFRPSVNTKYEFKVSRQIIEQVIRQKSKSQTFYNCSDGAKIEGTTPLQTANILILSSEQNKRDVMQNLQSKVFNIDIAMDFVEKFEEKFSHRTLMHELEVFADLLAQPVATGLEANQLIHKQKELMFESYRHGRSLLFYYLYGTGNYANAALIKCLQNTPSNDPVPDTFQQCLSIWADTLKATIHLLQSNAPHFDSTAQNRDAREIKLLRQKTEAKSLLVITNSKSFAESVKALVNIHYPWLQQITITSNTASSFDHPADYVIYYFNEQFSGATQQNTKLITGTIPAKGKQSTLIVSSANVQTIMATQQVLPHCSIMPYLMPTTMSAVSTEGNGFVAANTAINACLSEYQATIVMPKYFVSSDANQHNSLVKTLALPQAVCLDFYYHFAVYPDSGVNRIESNRGIIGALVRHSKRDSTFIFETLSTTAFAAWLAKQAELNPYLSKDAEFTGVEIISTANG